MLKISRNQLEALAKAKEGPFHQMLLKQLRVDYPEQTQHKADAALLDEIRQAHQQAKSYGILRNPALCQFIYLSIAFEPKFYHDPLVDKYLKEKPAKTEERLSMLLDVMIHHLERASRRRQEG